MYINLKMGKKAVWTNSKRQNYFSLLKKCRKEEDKEEVGERFPCMESGGDKSKSKGTQIPKHTSKKGMKKGQLDVV